MKCVDAVAAISMMLDGRLAGSDREELLSHIAACQACGARLESASRLHAILSRELSRRVSPPAGLQASIMAAVAREKGYAPAAAKPLLRMPHLWLRPLATAAAVAGLIAFGWMSNEHFSDRQTAPVPSTVARAPEKESARPLGNHETAVPAMPSAGTFPAQQKKAAAAVKSDTANVVSPKPPQPTPPGNAVKAGDRSSAVAENYWQNGDYARAIAYFHRTLDSNPGNPASYRNLAAAYQSLGMMAESIVVYNMGIRQTGDAQLMVELGKIQEKEGDMDNAVETYANATLADPSPYIEQGG